MRYRVTLAVATIFVGSSLLPALAQTPGAAAGAPAARVEHWRPPPLPEGEAAIGYRKGPHWCWNRRHRRGGVGNATGGINGAPRAGTGGTGDATGWGLPIRFAANHVAG